MARSYPIWIDVKACIYQSNKSFGAKATNEMNVLVGSSGSNSHSLGIICNTKRSKSEYKGFTDVIVFRLSVDNVILKEMIFKENKDGNAGELLQENSFLQAETIHNTHEFS